MMLIVRSFIDALIVHNTHLLAQMALFGTRILYLAFMDLKCTIVSIERLH